MFALLISAISLFPSLLGAIRFFFICLFDLLGRREKKGVFYHNINLSLVCCSFSNSLLVNLRQWRFLFLLKFRLFLLRKVIVWLIVEVSLSWILIVSTIIIVGVVSISIAWIEVLRTIVILWWHSVVSVIISEIRIGVRWVYVGEAHLWNLVDLLRCVLLEHSSLIHLEILRVESVIWVHHIHWLLLLRLKIVAIKIWIVCSWVVIVVVVALILVALSSKVTVGISEYLFFRVEVLEIPEDVWLSGCILVDLQHFLACSFEFQFCAVFATGDIIVLAVFWLFSENKLRILVFGEVSKIILW